MKCKSAVLWEQPGKWEICEVELDPPHAGELLIEMISSGMCHSDDHILLGNVPLPVLPACAGHEGYGVVREVGSGVTRFAPGDHIVTTFMPSCGHCRWCATGQQALCDNGALLFNGTQLDGTFRMHCQGKDVNQVAMISTFSEYSVIPQNSAVRVPADLNPISAGLLGCGVPTGWGSAVHVGQVSPGDTVIVIGTGGVGLNAVQGCRHASADTIIAVDLEPRKHEAALRFGATQATTSLDEAADAARALTNGQGADVVIITVGENTGELTSAALEAVRKAGVLVLTATGDARTSQAAAFNPAMFPMFAKRIVGTVYGGCSPARDIPRLAAMYQNGNLMLDELVSRTYSLDQINEGYADMRSGENLRGVIDFRATAGAAS